jgi:hypothetical protein
MLRGVLASQARGDEIDRAASGIELAARSATLTKLKPKTAAAVSSQRFVSSAVRIRRSYPAQASPDTEINPIK